MKKLSLETSFSGYLHLLFLLLFVFPTWVWADCERIVGWNRHAATAAAQEFADAAEMFQNTGDFSKSQSCFLEAARQHLLLGNIGRSESLVQNSLALAKSARDENGLGEGIAFLAELRALAGSRRLAFDHLNEAETFMTAITDERARGRFYLHAGQVYYAFEDVTGIWNSANLALKAFRKAGDQRGASQALVDLAFARFARFELLEALASAEESILIARGLGDRRTEGRALVAKGLVHTKLAELQSAKEAFRLAEDLFPTDLDRTERGVLLFNQGRVDSYLGVCSESLPYFESSVIELMSENNSALLIGALWATGEEGRRCGDIEKAISYLKKSAGLAAQNNARHSLLQATISLGRVLSSVGRVTEAMDEFLKAERMSVAPDTEWSKTQVLLEKGRTYFKMRQFDDAAKSLSHALDSSRKVRDVFLQAEILEVLARTHAAQGEYEMALDSARESVRLTDFVASGILASRDGASHLENHFLRYSLLTDLIMREGSNAFIGFIANERTRARNLQRDIVLAGHRGESTETRDRDREERLVLSALSSKRDQLILQFSTRENGEDGELADQIRTLERRLEDIRIENRRSGKFVAADLDLFDLQKFQQSLGPNDLVLEFSLMGDRNYLWLVSSKDVNAYSLATKEYLDSTVNHVHSLLLEQVNRTDEISHIGPNYRAERQSEFHRTIKMLSDALFSQVAGEISGKRLIIVADGRLQYFPIGALPWPGSDSDEPILATNEVVYAPSASVLQLIREQRRVEEPGRDLLVFSDPVFSKTDTRLTGLDVEPGRFDGFWGMLRSGRSLDELTRLPESEAEAKAIARTVGGFGTDVRSGFEANRDNVLNANLRDYKMLHFATHGVIEENRPELSGIVLSLFDEAGKKKDGGFIRLQDVYGMNLNSDLVVLSACDTGIGKEVRGEGLLSLTNAFLQAGSKTVVSSLWKVDDEATRILMTEFYRGMAEDGLTVSAALRQAQMKLYRDPKYSSPFYWAAFTVHGDYDRVPNISARYARYSTFVGVATVLLLAFFLFRVSRGLNRGY